MHLAPVVMPGSPGRPSIKASQQLNGAEGLQEAATSLGLWPSPHPILRQKWVGPEIMHPKAMQESPRHCMGSGPKPWSDQRPAAWGRRGGPTHGTCAGTRKGPVLPPRLHLDPGWGQDPLPVRTGGAAQPSCSIWLRTLANHCHQSSPGLLTQAVPLPLPGGPRVSWTPDPELSAGTCPCSWPHH